MRLALPVALYLDGALVVDDGRGLRAGGTSFPDPVTMLCKERRWTREDGWILEANGRFRELRLVGARREWARPLSFLWRFVRSEFTLTEPRSVTAGELKARLVGVIDPYEEAPVAADLRRFLDGYGDGEIVTKDILSAWPIQ